MGQHETVDANVLVFVETLEGWKRGGIVGTDRRVGSSNVGERFVFSPVYIFIIILFFALM